jgi:transcription elongation factor Elf1
MTETVTFNLSSGRREETWQAIDFYCLLCGKKDGVWIHPQRGTCLCLDCGGSFDMRFVTGTELVRPDDKMRLMALRKANGRDIWANQNLK